MDRLARISCVGGVVLGLSGLATGLAPAAGASTGGSPHLVPDSNYQGTSAGYISPQSTKVTHFKGSTDVPALNCSTSTGNPGTAVMKQSMQLYDNTTEAGSGIFINDECNSEAPSYQLTAFAGTNPTVEPTGITVSPGNIIAAVMTVSSKGIVTVSVHDVTTKSSLSTLHGTVATGGSYSAFAYIQNDLPAEPIPTFGRGLSGPGSGSIGWYHLYVDGKPMSNAHPTSYNMVNPANNDLMIKTSGFGSGGTFFSNSFVANQ